MRNLVLFILFAMAPLLTFSQDIKINDMPFEYWKDITLYTVHGDTSTAVIPDDFYQFCNCIAVETIAQTGENNISFYELHHGPFSPTEPYTYILGSIIEINDVKPFDKDTSLLAASLSLYKQSYYYSPYKPMYLMLTIEDVEWDIEQGDFDLYNTIVRRIHSGPYYEVGKIEEMLIINPSDLKALTQAASSPNTNLFLFKIAGSDEFLLQHYAIGEFDLEKLYSGYQLDKYELKLYMDLMGELAAKNGKISR